MQRGGSDEGLSHPGRRTAEWGQKPVGLQVEGLVQASSAFQKVVWPIDTHLVPSSAVWPVAMFLHTSMRRNPTPDRQRDGNRSIPGRIVEMKRRTRDRQGGPIPRRRENRPCQRAPGEKPRERSRVPTLQNGLQTGDAVRSGLADSLNGLFGYGQDASRANTPSSLLWRVSWLKGIEATSIGQLGDLWVVSERYEGRPCSNRRGSHMVSARNRQHGRTAEAQQP